MNDPITLLIGFLGAIVFGGLVILGAIVFGGLVRIPLWTGRLVDSFEGFLIVSPDGKNKAFCYGYSRVLRKWLIEQLSELNLPIIYAKGRSIRKKHDVVEIEDWVLYGIKHYCSS